MSIGLSLTPRSYNVDTTGRSYVLDPDPLLNVAEKAFASQRETQRQVQQVALQGVALGEFIGARQQLGRVKAQLSDLDVNDPQFATKYSAIVADNPLAFVNERLAPVTRAAVTPVLAAASQAMENKAALERARTMAGYQAQAAQQRYQYQQGMVDYRNANPRPATPRQPGLGERLLFGDLTESPQAAPPPAPVSGTPGSPSTPDVNTYAPQIPVDGSDGYGGGLIPFSPDDPRGPMPEDVSGLVEGEGDGPLTLPPSVRNTALGPMRVTNVGDGASLEPIVEAVPIAERPEGYMDIPDKVNPETGTAASRKLVPKPEKSATALKEESDAIDLVVGTDPEVAKLVGTASVLDAKHKGLVAAAEKMTPTQKELMAPQIAETAIEAAGAANVAKMRADRTKLALLAKSNPTAASALAERQFNDAVQSMPFYGPTMDDLTATPPAPAAQLTKPPPLSAKEQLTAQDRQVTDSAWDKEKKFALAEASNLDQKLGLQAGTVAAAVAGGNAADMRTILTTAHNRGVTSPLLQQIEVPTEGGTSYPTMQWGRSKAVNQSYRDVLRVAAKDPNYSKTTGQGAGYKWTRK
jgi:hypothetical protein